jgi:hypothetical protein
VRLHRGYYSPNSQAAAKINKTAVTPQAELNAAVAAAYPRRDLPALLVAHYVGSAEMGATLTASVGVSSEWLTFKGAGDGRSVAAVDLACVVVDDNGKQLQSFSTRLDATSATVDEAGRPRRDVMQDFQFKDLKPGLYQVRAGVRDAGSGRIGGVAGWIQIPDLSKGQLAIGSIITGESAGIKEGGDPMFAPVKLSAGRPLTRGAHLHFSTYVYNAMQAGGQLPPSITARSVVIGGGRILADSGECDVPTEGLDDLSRLPYSYVINLEALPPGRYVLQITATDRVAGKSVTQLAKFSVG